LDELARPDIVVLPEEVEALSRQNLKLYFVVGPELTPVKQNYRIVAIFP
jgi:hypothetical protein